MAANIITKCFVWFDKRYVVSKRAKRAAILAQQAGKSFDELYELTN